MASEELIQMIFGLSHSKPIANQNSIILSCGHAQGGIEIRQDANIGLEIVLNGTITNKEQDI